MHVIRKPQNQTPIPVSDDDPWYQATIPEWGVLPLFFGPKGHPFVQPGPTALGLWLS